MVCIYFVHILYIYFLKFTASATLEGQNSVFVSDSNALVQTLASSFRYYIVTLHTAMAKV